MVWHVLLGGVNPVNLSRLHVSNYRALRDCRIDLSPFVCIIGENNTGKSTVLLALSLFLSGSRIDSSDFYDPSQPVRFEVTLSDISDDDLERIAPEHRDRVEGIVANKELTLVRCYGVDGSSSDYYYLGSVPKDKRFDPDVIDKILKGKRGSEIRDILESHLPEFKSQFAGITSQSAAKEKIQEIITALPESEKTMGDLPLPTGISNSIKRLLPEPIYIPAVKDLTDEIKIKESATFGKLIGVLLRMLEGTVEVQEIAASFEKLNSMLNRTSTENGAVVDNRLPHIREIESQVLTYLRENFPTVDLQLHIPPPELKQVFSSTKIMVDDGVRDVVETKGDGLKRSVTFALLRSYVDLQMKQRAPMPEDQQLRRSSGPHYLFLFEEPELYLHPSGQRILFKALTRLSEQHHVVVTTHSPLFFSPTGTGTFIKLAKDHPPDAKPYGNPMVINLLHDTRRKDAFQLICYENNSAAFFARKVVLVEGDSDAIYLAHVARILNEEWDFEARNIPLIRINGKGNVARYREFFEKFGLEVHAILDLDALLEDFDKLEVTEDVADQRRAFLQVIDKIAKDEGIDGTLTREKIKEMVRKYTWQERYQRLKYLAREIANGRQITNDEADEIELLFSEETETRRRNLLRKGHPELHDKYELLERLRELRINVLAKGAIEDYYPNGVTGVDKPTRALRACELITMRDQILALCPKVVFNGREVSEFEAIFRSIFDSE
ncbi:MAG: ATP-dependent endonuclease [Firmicutes bacterium]|nr:ATP-dependent endonuclease [Bacillota bacterium]